MGIPPNDRKGNDRPVNHLCSLKNGSRSGFLHQLPSEFSRADMVTLLTLSAIVARRRAVSFKEFLVARVASRTSTPGACAANPGRIPRNALTLAIHGLSARRDVCEI